jgi:hypothetical protein
VTFARRAIGKSEGVGRTLGMGFVRGRGSSSIFRKLSRRRATARVHLALGGPADIIASPKGTFTAINGLCLSGSVGTNNAPTNIGDFRHASTDQSEDAEYVREYNEDLPL